MAKCANGHDYCCEDHLSAHGKEDYCFPFKIEESEEFGRYFVATRDIQPLELVLIDKPAVVGPATKTRPICLECFKGPLEPENSVRCQGCHFPLCKSCAAVSTSKAVYHGDVECEILAKANIGKLVSKLLSISQIRFCCDSSLICYIFLFVLVHGLSSEIESLVSCVVR